jgi:hypothetical protein
VRPVCFSPQADLIGGITVSVLGIDALRHVEYRQQVALASLPLLLGAHQLVETFVWWGLQGHVSPSTGDVAKWIYLVVAFVVLPVFVPLAVLSIEPERTRQRLMVPFALLGAVVSVTLGVAMINGPVTAKLDGYHLEYAIGLRYGWLIVGLYVAATCGSLLVSSFEPVVIFGAVNLVVVVVLAWFEKNGFASLWCAWAAITSVAIVAHLRFERPVAMSLAREATS